MYNQVLCRLVDSTGEIPHYAFSRYKGYASHTFYDLLQVELVGLFENVDRRSFGTLPLAYHAQLHFHILS